jgi:hypothetical protein
MISNRLHFIECIKSFDSRWGYSIANRLVIPSLTPDQLGKFRTGELNLDTLIKAILTNGLSINLRSLNRVLKLRFWILLGTGPQKCGAILYRLQANRRGAIRLFSRQIAGPRSWYAADPRRSTGCLRPTNAWLCDGQSPENVG